MKKKDLTKKEIEYNIRNSGKRRLLLKPVIAKLHQQASSTEIPKIVSISGAVKVPGEYPLVSGASYIDLVELAGSFSDDAYIESAELRRTITDENGNDNSEWKKMDNVSDLSRVERQQYLVVQLLGELENFSSFAELLQFIQALEETFVVDEGLSVNKATNILWDMRTIELDNITKLTIPTSPYELNDGRQVLILNGNFYDFAEENLLIDE